MYRLAITLVLFVLLGSRAEANDWGDWGLEPEAGAAEPHMTPEFVEPEAPGHDLPGRGVMPADIADVERLQVDTFDVGIEGDDERFLNRLDGSSLHDEWDGGFGRELPPPPELHHGHDDIAGGEWQAFDAPFEVFEEALGDEAYDEFPGEENLNPDELFDDPRFTQMPPPQLEPQFIPEVRNLVLDVGLNSPVGSGHF